MGAKSFFVEHKVGDEWVEYEYEVEYRFNEGSPAITSGPPERCDPGEGPSVDDFEGPLKRCLVADKASPWETVPFSVFLEGLVEQKQFQDDPSGGFFNQTALDKARRWVEDELCEAGEDDARAAYEDSMETMAEIAREEGRSRW